jgi:hypothetical protein
MTDKDLKQFITGRQKKLESLREPMLSVWQNVSEYVNIGLGDMTNTTNQTIQSLSALGKKSFNGTAIGAAVLATSGIHGYHVSPAFPWFSYMMSRNVLNKVPDIKEWLQAEEQEVYTSLNNSNFYAEMWPFIFNGFTVGTAAIYGEYDYNNNQINFECIHPKELYIEENAQGVVDVVHRKYRLSARKLVQKFGLENVPPGIRQAYRNNPFQDFEIIHAVFPREEYDDRKKDAKNKKYSSVWYATSVGKVLLESGYDEFPFKVWRYMRFSNYAYGLSPAILSMCDIKGLNIVSKTMYGAAQMFLDPPLNVPSDLVGNVQWKPRGINPYDKENMFVRPVTMNGNFPVPVDRELKLENSLKERFHVDTFLMLASLEGRGQRTAYEVSEMMGEKAAILGAELSPLNVQMDSILEMVYSIHAGLHPENRVSDDDSGSITMRPDALYELSVPGDSFTPVYMGPLAQAQRRLYKTQGMQAAMEAVAPALNLFPQSVRVINGDETIRAILESHSFPQKAIVSEKDVAIAKQAEEQAMAEQQQREVMDAGAKTIEVATKADKNMDGKLSEMIMENAGSMNAGA